MISQQDLERILERESTGRTILSLFLDMSVDSDNKRTYPVFLNQQRAHFDELESERPSNPREAIGRAFQQVEQWLDEKFDESNRGVALYLELGGPWFEAFQLPAALPNRLVLSERPVIAPLVQLLGEHRHLGVVLLDREKGRILSIFLGTVLEEIEVAIDPYPTAHNVQAGGLSQRRFQRSKREEAHHFFRELAGDLERFVRQEQPDEVIVLGTDETVAAFRDFLPERIQELITLTAPMWVEEAPSDILARIEPYLRADRERDHQDFLKMLRERIEQDYFATAGYPSTLTALQEGKVARLAIANDHQQSGSRCSRCGYIFADARSTCPYDGSATVQGIDLFEEVVRLAEGQGLGVEFAAPAELQDLQGVGAILRF